MATFFIGLALGCILCFWPIRKFRRERDAAGTLYWQARKQLHAIEDDLKPASRIGLPCAACKERPVSRDFPNNVAAICDECLEAI